MLLTLVIPIVLGTLVSLPSADGTAAGASPDGLRLEHVQKISAAAPHSAFTGLVRHDRTLFCVFREAAEHAVTPTSSIRVLGSEDDGRTWKSYALITSPDEDLRDPKIVLMPDKRLMLHAAAVRQPAVDGVTHRNFAWFSRDGRAWGERTEIGEANVWLWRITWHDGMAYGIGYSVTKDRFLRLYASRDGRRFDVLVEKLSVAGYPNEASSILFGKGGTASVLVRRDPEVGLLGTAKPPYREWSWRDLDRRIGGPEVMTLADGRVLAATRLYDQPVRTGLSWFDAERGKLTEFLTLPSGGDTSYAGIVAEGDRVWVSYYSSHEGKTAVYLATLRLMGRAAATQPK